MGVGKWGFSGWGREVFSIPGREAVDSSRHQWQGGWEVIQRLPGERSKAAGRAGWEAVERQLPKEMSKAAGQAPQEMGKGSSSPRSRVRPMGRLVE